MEDLNDETIHGINFTKKMSEINDLAKLNITVTLFVPIFQFTEFINQFYISTFSLITTFRLENLHQM